MSSVIWVSEAIRPVLCAHLADERLRPLAGTIVVVQTLPALVDAAQDEGSLIFVDESTIEGFASVASPFAGRVIVVSSEPIATAVEWLASYPWVSHVVSATLLPHPMADEHLANVVRALAGHRSPRLLDWIGSDISGRRVRLTQASRRAARIERMNEFFVAKGVATRSLEVLRDIAEELLTNAFYDAPAAAGAIAAPVSRTRDITLPQDAACDLAYGCRDDLAVVRVRDPFGSLSRTRLISVLERCARPGMRVEVDETMGGAGLGMWRIFSRASFVAISVVKNRHTEVLAGIAKRSAASARPFAFHLFFRRSSKRTMWNLAEDASGMTSIRRSVMLSKAK